MATATMATAAGMVVLLYVVLSRRLLSTGDGGAEQPAKVAVVATRRRRPERAPATWRETAATLAETLRFTYAETLGKWPIADLAFGIKYLMRRQGSLEVSSVYAGDSCVKLQGPEIMSQLIYLLRLLNLCFLFSKKPFSVFLETSGYSKEDVLMQEPKAGLLKPSFTVLCDNSSKCFLLLIRGTHSIKDTLTAATGAVVPFHHLLLDEGGVSKLVLGYAHCGMVAAARWIANCTTPCLLKAIKKHPDYTIKIVGHSLGGGTAALLTYVLREHTEFSSCTCVAFAPAACMTWDLAESGKHFITTIINGSDLIPTFSTASIDDLRSEVTASSWLNDVRDQVQNTRFLNIVYRSASTLGSRMASISGARARVAVASAFLHPVSSKTQVMVKQAQNVAQAVVRSRSSLSAWSCMGPRRRVTGTCSSAEENRSTSVREREDCCQVIEEIKTKELVPERDLSCLRDSDQEDSEVEQLLNVGQADCVSTVPENLSEGDLWFELEKELNQHDELDIRTREEEAAAAKEITEEENEILEESGNQNPAHCDATEKHQFFPPGRIMHMVAFPVQLEDNLGEDLAGGEDVGIYETPRELYSKIRLCKSMINDHYMPMYTKMMGKLIEKLEEEHDGSACTSMQL